MKIKTITKSQHILLACPLMNLKRRVGQKYMMQSNHDLYVHNCIYLGGQFW